MEEYVAQRRAPERGCPGCGVRTKLYRTPRGLRCADCVKEMDSAGMSFR
ncbi:MAG: hypothetical protein JRN27_05185 [Nitrososphaerota archaeon]|nr:hypothetical protein [Nitrososphaerota archaeon]MDG6964449.1 hypothetical protein [Nitrososphaerota archaeon]MDG6973891.1 hypothetical protein [Nitrososphaerota archaeon]MDG6975464.1 hypothetical protein [Nitrososphaerota archaeon]